MPSTLIPNFEEDVVGRAPAAGLEEVVGGRGLGLRGLALLEPLEHLVDDDLG